MFLKRATVDRSDEFLTATTIQSNTTNHEVLNCAQTVPTTTQNHLKTTQLHLTPAQLKAKVSPFAFNGFPFNVNELGNE